MLALSASDGGIPVASRLDDSRYRVALWLCRFAIVLSLAVILLGGWTRLNDAGLSCPDWPGCYGELVLPSSEAGQALAQARYQQLPLDLSRGWLEMGHRYLAGTLGLMIAALAWLGWRQRRQAGYPLRLSLLLLALVMLQGLFGMWTVTLKLLPQIVTLHLLGGLLTLSLLLRLSQRLAWAQSAPLPRPRTIQATTARPAIRRWLGLGLLLLMMQIGLGGWTSANYAGWSCSHWFSCERAPTMILDYASGFALPAWQTVEQSSGYQGGLLPRPARAAIQMTHRMMGLLLAIYLLALVIVLIRHPRYRYTAVLLLALLGGQLLLGVLNVQFGLPLSLAFAHHVGAVLLLVTLVRLFGLTEQGFNQATVDKTSY